MSSKYYVLIYSEKNGVIFNYFIWNNFLYFFIKIGTIGVPLTSYNIGKKEEKTLLQSVNQNKGFEMKNSNTNTIVTVMDGFNYSNLVDVVVHQYDTKTFQKSSDV